MRAPLHEPSPGEATALLHRLAEGDEDAGRRLFEVLHAAARRWIAATLSKSKEKVERNVFILYEL